MMGKLKPKTPTNFMVKTMVSGEDVPNKTNPLIGKLWFSYGFPMVINQVPIKIWELWADFSWIQETRGTFPASATSQGPRMTAVTAKAGKFDGKFKGENIWKNMGRACEIWETYGKNMGNTLEILKCLMKHMDK
jgi:hypothetical protein